MFWARFFLFNLLFGFGVPLCEFGCEFGFEFRFELILVVSFDSVLGSLILVWARFF